MQHKADIPAIAFQIWRPQSAHTAHERVYDRLVERRVPGNEFLVPLGKGRGVARNEIWIIAICKFLFEPERAAVMNKVDYRVDLQLFDNERNYLVGQTPVKLSRLGLDLVPRSAPADSIQTKVTRQAKVFAPVAVMADQLKLVERTSAVPRLRDKCVFYSGRPNKFVSASLARDLISQNNKSSKGIFSASSDVPRKIGPI